MLQLSQRQQYDSLASSWREMDPEALCALVNDNQRMQEKCDEFGDQLLSQVRVQMMTHVDGSAGGGDNWAAIVYIGNASCRGWVIEF